MIFDMGSERIQRHQVQCFWAGIMTVISVAVYRIFVTFSGMAKHVHLDTWMTNGIILWSMTLFVLAWLFWRDARRRQDEFAAVMRSISPDVLLVTDSTGKVVICNPAMHVMFGYKPEALLGHTTETFLQDRPTGGSEQEVYDRLRQKGYEVRPGFGLRQDGTKFPIELTTARFLNHTGTVMLIRDITERRRVEQLRENLTHILVHDLRNPLFGISGNLNLISMYTPNLPEDARTSVRAALDCVQSLREMLQCVEEVSQLETGERPLRITESDVSQLVDDAWETVKELAKEKRHTFVWSRTSSSVRCDPELIGRVVLNLLRNAIQATPSGGQIIIRVERTAERLRLSVRDNGPGIPSEYLSLIFEKFGHMPDGQMIKRRSNGLGMIFCKLAVDAHGGSIGVESEPDNGNTFWFELPEGDAHTVSLQTDKQSTHKSEVHT